MDAFCIVYP
jgi:hypothetical protein